MTPEKSFSYKEVEKFVGQLVHTTYIVPNMQCYMPPLHRWKKEWKNQSVTRSLPENVEVDLTEWLRVLESFECRRLIPSLDPVDVGWVGEASLSAGVSERRYCLGDNMTSECVVAKHRSNDRSVNAEWKKIQDLLVSSSNDGLHSCRRPCRFEIFSLLSFVCLLQYLPI